MIQTIKQNKKAVLAFFLALVMLIGLIPFTATEVQAVTIPVGDITNNDSFGTGGEAEECMHVTYENNTCTVCGKKKEDGQ